ncbi:MAG: SIMPL domain-containing protein [Acidobacteria bacterium]|nr:SIMPL domain-containing protein [Acidobacteriota bacterium]
MRMIPRPLPVIFALAALACAVSCSEKKESVRTRLLVTGESDSRVPPDTAVVVLSVVTQSRGALDAQRQNARKSEAVINAVKAVAGASPEVETSDYALVPQRDYGGQMPRIVGYEARNSVSVTTSALDAVGAVIDAATGAGANSVDGVSFILRESNAARGRALGDASRQAMQKAEAMAEAMNGRIVRVVEQREGGFPERPAELVDNDAAGTANMNADVRAYANKMSPRTPVAAGTLNVRSQVFLVVEVEARPR